MHLYNKQVKGRTMKELNNHIIQVKNGDEASYRYVIQALQQPLFNYIFKMIRDYQEAEDIVQDSFLAAYYNIQKLKDPSSFNSWLYKIAYNKCLQVIKKKKRIVYTNKISEVEAPKRDLDINELFSDLKAAEHSLLLLRVQGFTFDEISHILKITPSASRKRFERIKTKLKTQYENERRYDGR